MNEIRRERNRDLFIQIAYDIIKKEGMEAATIRNIAQVAGYNSATLYSYFDNQAHILFCAYMRFEEDLLKILQDAVSKSKQPFYVIWPDMYLLMVKYYFDNPNLFDCAYVTVYDKDGGRKRRQQREQESVLDQYLISSLQQISRECHMPMEEVISIHRICFSYIIGTVLMVLKERMDEPSQETVLKIEGDLKSIISLRLPQNLRQKNDE